VARSRTLKPEFWTDEVIVELSFPARLFYQGCWNFALCDHGHLDDSPKSLKLKILPADDVDPVALVDELIKHGRLVRKETPDGRTYLHVSTLAKHTKMDTRWNTRCQYCALEGLTKPASPRAAPDDLTETHASSDELSETPPSKGKESKGKESKESGARKRGTRIPDDFTVTPEMVAWAREKCPNVDGKRETEKFIHHWRGETGVKATKLDWDATWKKWMLTAADYRSARASPQPDYEPAYLQPLARSGAV